MYQLTLTRSDRDAFDFNGYRYNNGDLMREVLTDCMAPDQEWSDDGDITFDIPEHLAWRIDELAREEEYMFTCFDYELTQKMMDFIGQIV